MPNEPATLFNISHLVTFLGGAAAGSAGTYLADKYTDQRRAKKAAQERKQRFSELQSLMKSLFEEIIIDLNGDNSGTIREFVILPNDRVTFNSSLPRFSYFESTHPHVRNQCALLREAGYIQDVSVGSAPIFRMSEEFVRLLKKS